MPLTCIRCAPMVPASGGRRRRPRRGGPSPPGRSPRPRRAGATGRRRATSSEPAKEAPPCASTPRGSKVAGSRPKPMRSKIISGELREDMSANSSISRWSSRRCSEVRTSGSASVMNPGLEPVLCSEEPPCCAGRLDPVGASPGSSRAGLWNSLRVDTTFDAGLEQPAQHVDVHPVAHVEDAVRLQGEDLPDVPRGHARRWAPCRTARRRRARLVLRVDVQPDEVEVRDAR